MRRLALGSLSLAVALGLWSSAADASRPASGKPETRRLSVGRGKPRPTIVYLHGLGSQPDDGVGLRLARAVAERGNRLEVVAPWLRPVELDADGEPRATGDHTMTDQLERARAAIRDVQGPVVLMGHSFGGKAALVLAREIDRVAGVIGLAPSVKMLHSYWKQLTSERGLPDPATILAGLDRHEAELGRELASLRARKIGGEVRRKAERALTGELGYLRVMRDLVAHDETAVERGLVRPTLVVHGGEDQAVSIHYARRLIDDNPGLARLVELAGVDHGFVVLRDGPGGEPEVDRAATDVAVARAAAEIERFLDDVSPAAQR